MINMKTPLRKGAVNHTHHNWRIDNNDKNKASFPITSRSFQALREPL